MPLVYLLTGSNAGNRLLKLQQARQQVGLQIGNIMQTTAVYETAPWGNTQQPPFLNQVLVAHTVLQPHEVLAQITRIEKKLGRIRREKWGQRTIDIDILLYGSEIIETEKLTIPHPWLPQRRFALTPLAEISPELIHPQLHLSIKQLLQQCPDELPVYVYQPLPTDEPEGC
ncbi:2-amino-4-hydroxy-6-hydroxymethyldihydropteridine diphosphokinase [Sphingobacteriales bacterium UPWRP_1]|nr:2-amino-4-hydroxy-6-hydroxymethyldihydropteridine diphosphokinase [Sphingobacteriales bacterium TSM_CSM]PSJ71523.1 2-amino-4-hydroxy-6-hydroxymethyldihydropteridine diphosphokinase [Sphingobacteriales bacterium UPWRP_1]